MSALSLAQLWVTLNSQIDISCYNFTVGHASLFDTCSFSAGWESFRMRESGQKERGRERPVAKRELILTPSMHGSTWHAVDGVHSRVAANESSLSLGSPGGKTASSLTSIIASWRPSRQ